MAAAVRLPDPPTPTRRWRDLLVLAASLALIAVSAVVGHALVQEGLVVVLPAPPLVAYWSPHVGWGTPLVIACVLLGLRVQRAAAKLPWRRLVLTGWLLNLAWLASLTLVDGLQNGWIEVLEDPNEYLEDVPRILDPLSFLATFTHYIAFGPGVDGDNVWTTHVAAHPPLATLLFWFIARLGLPGGFWAGLVCILVGSTVSVALPVTLRELGAGDAARRLVPFVALFPGAVWMAVSADGLFAGVALSGLALVCVGAARGLPLVGLAGGLLLGAAVFLSYGSLLVGIVVIIAFSLSVRELGLRQVLASWLLATGGFVTIIAVHLALGFNWLTGLDRLHLRYYQGIASQRPFSYFVYANLAAWLISCSPLLAVAILRSVAVFARRHRAVWTQDQVAAAFCLAGTLCAVIANLSALSKAETERIWLTFGAAAAVGFALFRGRAAAWALVAAAGWAIIVNHLLDTGW